MIPLNRLSRSEAHRNLAGYLPNIQMSDGAVNERAKTKIEEAQQKNGDMALPYYESDK